ncbi:hypothetical protein D3C86_1347180 [compost metagenome]
MDATDGGTLAEVPRQREPVHIGAKAKQIVNGGRHGQDEGVAPPFHQRYLHPIANVQVQGRCQPRRDDKSIRIHLMAPRGMAHDLVQHRIGIKAREFHPLRAVAVA